MNDDEKNAEVFELLAKQQAALDDYETYAKLRDIAAVAQPEPAPDAAIGWDMPFGLCLRG